MPSILATAIYRSYFGTSEELSSTLPQLLAAFDAPTLVACALFAEVNFIGCNFWPSSSDHVTTTDQLHPFVYREYEREQRAPFLPLATTAAHTHNIAPACEQECDVVSHIAGRAAAQISLRRSGMAAQKIFFALARGRLRLFVYHDAGIGTDNSLRFSSLSAF